MKTLHAFVVLSRPTSYIGINITSISCMCYDLAYFKNFPFACSVNSPKLLNSNMFLLGVIFLLCIVFFWALLMSYNITYLHTSFLLPCFLISQSTLVIIHLAITSLWVCNSFLLLFFSLFYCARDENKYKQPYIRIIHVKCLFKGSRQENHECMYFWV